MSRQVLRIVACALLAVRTGAQDPVPKRTPVGPPIEDPPLVASRVQGSVQLGEWIWYPRMVHLRLLGQGLQGEEAIGLGCGPFDFPVEGGEGRFAWAIWTPGHDPVQGSLELRPGEIVELGEISPRPGSGVIEGRVRDLDGRPVSGADVRVGGWLVPVPPDSGKPAPSVKTDAEGRFRFEGVPAGRGYVQVDATDLAAIPPRFVEMKAWGSCWLELAPVVGTLAVSVHRERGGWDRGFSLVLCEEDQRMRVVRWTGPPTTDDVDRVVCGRIRGGCSGCRIFSLVLEPALPGASLLGSGVRPGIRNVGAQTQSEVLPDGSGALLRNVPAGTWDVSLWTPSGEGTAEPARVAIIPGGTTSLTIWFQ
jgi:carboxypeptidase family protein